ncbi:MAG TPA: class I SAM-dependent methyltransferase [Rubrivivax sp.]|nr:class I SAM-dependent methyltransferase [Rubrivivax sp.]
MDKQAHQQQYDLRYAGDYMDGDAYSRWVHEGLATRRVRETLEAIPVSPLSLLDYGCGQGKWTELLHAMYPSAAITGVDVSAVAVERAAQKHPDCRFLAFDGEHAPLADASFDLVFSFHVLEHVLDIHQSIRDMSRLLRPGGYACIIFPCGNKGSFEERLVGLMKQGRVSSSTGETIFFFERPEGHLRRLESSKTVAAFAAAGLQLEREYYSGQFFASLDWLVRGTGPHYINQMFCGGEPVSGLAAVKLRVLRSVLLRTHRFLRLRDLDVERRRSLPKRVAARLAKTTAATLDRTIHSLAQGEWQRRRTESAGSVQYLVFRKNGATCPPARNQPHGS